MGRKYIKSFAFDAHEYEFLIMGNEELWWNDNNQIRVLEIFCLQNEENESYATDKYDLDFVKDKTICICLYVFIYACYMPDRKGYMLTC